MNHLSQAKSFDEDETKFIESILENCIEENLEFVWIFSSKLTEEEFVKNLYKVAVKVNLGRDHDENGLIDACLFERKKENNWSLLPLQQQGILVINFFLLQRPPTSNLLEWILDFVKKVTTKRKNDLVSVAISQSEEQWHGSLADYIGRNRKYKRYFASGAKLGESVVFVDGSKNWPEKEILLIKEHFSNKKEVIFW